jgi:LptD protein
VPQISILIQIWKILAEQKKDQGILFAQNLSVLVISLLFFSGSLTANTGPRLQEWLESDSISPNSVDTISVINKDSTQLIMTDSLLVDSLSPPPSNSGIKTTISYSARDSMRVDAINKLAYLYGNAHVTYGKVDLTADYMEIDLAKNEVKATYSLDSLENPVGKPVFKDGSDMFVADLIRYNFQSKKGLVSGVVTQQGEGYIHGDRVKFNEEMESFINDAKYTTCNLPNPHFHIKAKKIKMIPEKKVITGPFYMQVNDIPTPLGFAFGMFPIPKEKASGLIIPKYGEAQDRGFFLRDGGYYWAFNDNMAMKFIGEIYTNGSWGLQYNNQYKKRYAYDGNFNLKYNKKIQGVGEDRQENNDYWVKWRHTPVQKGPYGGRLTAEVSAGSNNYNQRNSYNIDDFQTAQFNSNITWAKSFRNTPLNATVTLRQSQNTSSGIIDLTLPNFNLSSNRLYPFKNSRTLKKSDFFKKLAIGPRLDFQNKMTNKAKNTTSLNGVTVVNGVKDSDSIALEDQSFRRLRLSSNSGAKISAPISTSMKAFKYFNINPSLSLTEYLYYKKLDIRTDTSGVGVNVDTVLGFSSSLEYSARAAVTTRIYGTFFFKNSKRIKAIRHTFIPTISGNFKPDFSQTGNSYTEVVVNDSTGEKKKFSIYNGFIYGGPSANEQASLGINLTSILEMKKVDKNDSLGRTKKVKLLDNLSLSGNYNFAAKKFKMSKINLNAVTKLGRFNFNLGMVFDPYTYRLDSFINGQPVQERIDEFTFNTNNKLLNTERVTFNVSTNLNPKAFEPTKPKSNEGTKEELEYIQENPDLYVDFNIPWNLRMGYNIVWSKIGHAEANVIQNFQFSGDLKVTEKWKVGFRSAIDMVKGELSTTSINIYRDLHCWQMSLNWIPTGQRAGFTFDIAVKSSILQDMKLSKRNSFYDR